MSRAALSSADHRLILGVLDGVSGAVDADDFAAAVVVGVRAAVPCDVVTLNEVDPAKDRVVFVAEPASWTSPPGTSQILAELAGQHPLVRLFNETGDGSAHKISDFWASDVFHGTDLYRRVYGPMRVEFQMSITLPAPRPVIVAVVLNREDRDFDERDRLVLNTLRPHLAQMWRSTRDRARLAGLLGAAANALTAGETGVVAVGDPPQEVTPGSVGHLVPVLRSSGPISPMPAKVDRWLALCRVERGGDGLPSLARPLVATVNGRTAILRYLPGRAGQPDVILVTETEVRRGVGHLEALGLTTREAQVLELVAAGATNAAAGRELHISAGTVKKHLDHIYTKLAVTGRVQAAAVLHEMAAHHAPKHHN